MIQRDIFDNTKRFHIEHKLVVVTFNLGPFFLCILKTGFLSTCPGCNYKESYPPDTQQNISDFTLYTSRFFNVNHTLRSLYQHGQKSRF